MKGLFFMFLNTIFMTVTYFMQKVIIKRANDSGNPINAFEVTYFQALIMLPMMFIIMRYQGANLFPLPQPSRSVYVWRCVLAFLTNVCYILSYNFISFSKASVIMWSNPIFTAVGARYFLNESLTVYDWAAVVIAFGGILIMQNPFG